MKRTRTTKRAKKNEQPEADNTYLLKIILYLLLGSVWLQFASPLALGGVELRGIPIGLLVGLLLASHDHFQVDRKIEYALLILVAIITFFLPAGIVI